MREGTFDGCQAAVTCNRVSTTSPLSLEKRLKTKNKQNNKTKQDPLNRVSRPHYLCPVRFQRSPRIKYHNTI